MKWDALATATLQGAQRRDHQLLLQRFVRMLCVLIDSDNKAMLYRPQIGDRQGDGPAAQRYVLAQDPAIREWQCQTTDPFEKSCVELFDPWSERWIAPTHALFADDLVRFGVARSVRELIWKIAEWRGTLKKQRHYHWAFNNQTKSCKY